MQAVIIYYPDELGRQREETEGGIYTDISRRALSEDYGIDDDNIILYLPLKVSGRTYTERQSDLHDKAVEWSNTLGAYPAWSYGELGDIQSFFEQAGRRYGLIKEFRENGII